MWNTVSPSFLIGLRDGLEGGLTVSVLLAVLVRAGARDRIGTVRAGVAAAVALSLSFAAVLTFTSTSLSTGAQDAFGAVLSLSAAGFVTAVVFWLRRDARALSGDPRAWGGPVLALTAFLAVAREGLQTSLFLWTTAESAAQAKGPALGAGLGLPVAVALCWGLYRRALKIDFGRFFAAAGAVLIVIAAGVFAHGLGDLWQGGIVPGYAAPAVNLHGVDAGSWYATLIAGTLNLTPVMTWLQVGGYLLYLVPTTALFVLGVRRGASTAPALARVDRPATTGPNRRMPRWAVYTSLVVVPAVAAVGTISVMGTAKSAADIDIAITEEACGTGWSHPAGGDQSFVVRNEDSNTAEVYLINPTGNAVYGEDPDVTPGSTQTMNVDLGAGRYVFRCSFVDGTVLNSATYRVTGSGPARPGLAPISEQDLQAPVAQYRGYVQQSLPTLLAAAERLDADLRAGDLARAKADWLPAHLDYERLGAAYGTFEDFDQQINGAAGGLPQGTATQDWTGFFRIEYGLWHGQSAAVLAPLGDSLVSDIKGLIQSFPDLSTPGTDLPLRTHEILENALQFQLTGIEDYGSGTTLATLYANTEGTAQVLAAISGLIKQRDPALLGQIDTGLATLRRDLAALGAGPCAEGCAAPDSLASLTTAQRQRVDADLDRLLETLAAVPDLLEERTAA